jgi:hypothetical protein
MPAGMRAAPAPLLILILNGCAGDVPKASLVEDMRVLAIRAEPPEILIDREAPAAATPVTFHALVVDPRGLPMSYEWRFCPVESDQTCGDFAQVRERAPEGFRPVLDAARAQQRVGDAPPERQPSGAVELGAFDIAVSPEIFAYHLGASALGLGNGAWTSAVLAVGTGGEKLSAQKRLTLNARDLSQWNPELAAAGWQVCAPPVDGAVAVAPAGCLPLRPRTANRNPVIAGVELARGKAANLPFAPLSGTLLLAPGETVRLRPVLPPETAEAYQSIESTLAGSNLVVVDRSEEAIVSWFATDGEFDLPQTAPQLTKTLDNEFTAPAVVPAVNGGQLTIFIVVRDQRGGVGWTRLEVTVAGP